jgi:hypothetical protein
MLIHWTNGASGMRHGVRIIFEIFGFVVAGFIPAVHALFVQMPKGVDARDKPGHDGL